MEQCEILNAASLNTERCTVLSRCSRICGSFVSNNWKKNKYPDLIFDFFFPIYLSKLPFCELKWFISLFVAVFPQWKPFIQNIQAQEEYPGGFSSVWAVETRRGDAGEWKPAHGGHVARGGRLKWVGRRQQWVLPFAFLFFPVKFFISTPPFLSFFFKNNFSFLKCQFVQVVDQVRVNFSRCELLAFPLKTARFHGRKTAANAK